MAGTRMEGGAMAPAAADRLGYAASVLIFYAACLALVLGDVADGRLFHGDVDDQMRALQIGYLYAGKAGWFDLTLPFVQMPEAYVSPWSRLVDLPYVALATVFDLALSEDEALKLAFLVWPPLLLSAFAALVVAVARRLADGVVLPHLTEALALVAMAVTMAIGILEFAPGRIDHHNVQLVAMLAIALGLLRWDRIGGVLVGAGSTVSVVVGLECLPFIVLAYAGIVIADVSRVRGARSMLCAAAFTMLAATSAGAVVFLGPSALATRCDAFSAPYVWLMAGLSLALLIAARLTPYTASAVRRIAMPALTGAFVLFAAVLLFPACLDGPYAMIDPLSRAGWFERIWQEKSFLYLLRHGQHSLAAGLALEGIVLAAVVPFVLAGEIRRRPGVLTWLVIALVALALSLYVTRYIRFPAVFVPLFLPALLGCLVAGGAEQAKRAGGLLTAPVVAASAVLYLLTPAVEPSFDAIDYMAFDECKAGDFAVLGTVPPGRIAVPQGLSLPLIKAMPDGFSVAAVPFHRAAPGMRRMLEAFTADDPELRRAALSPFDYLAVCRFALRPETGDSPFYAALAAGSEWPGLARLDDGRDDFQLFRIDHAALR